MVESGNKTKTIGILIAAVLVVGLVISVLVIWGPTWFNSSDKQEMSVTQAQLIVYKDGETITQPVEKLSDLIAEADKPIFIDFWAAWCGPCKLAAPFVESLAEEYQDKAHIVKVNIDEQPGIASAFKVQSIPTFMVIENGEIKSAKMGYADHLQAELKSMIDLRLQ